MALTLDLDVVWPDLRRVRVLCHGWPLLSQRGDDPDQAMAVVNDVDVVSEASLHTFLRRITRLATDGQTVEAGGLEPTVFTILETLEITGPPPRPIVIRLATT
jgi:hypothetical protein